MKKLILLFLIDHCIEQIEAKYKARYDKLSNDVKQKEANDE